MVAQYDDPIDDEAVEPKGADALYEADAANALPYPGSNAIELDEGLDEVISAEGELGTRGAAVGQRPVAMDVDTSLDDLLDTFVDEELAADALVEADSYSSAAREDHSASGAQLADGQAKVGPAVRPAAAPVALHPEVRAEQPVGVLQPLDASAASRSSDNVKVSRERRGGFWRGLGLMLLGGILGAGLTLLGLRLWSGTLDYASRSQLDALSSNMNTMHANQELTWERVNDVEPRLAEQDAALAEMSQQLTQAQQQMEAAQAAATALSQEVTALREQLTSALDQNEARMATLESQAAALDADVSALESRVSPLQSAVERFSGFFTQMRDLLIKLQGAP